MSGGTADFRNLTLQDGRAVGATGGTGGNRNGNYAGGGGVGGSQNGGGGGGGAGAVAAGSSPGWGGSGAYGSGGGGGGGGAGIGSSSYYTSIPRPPYSSVYVSSQSGRGGGPGGFGGGSGGWGGTGYYYSSSGWRGTTTYRGQAGGGGGGGGLGAGGAVSVESGAGASFANVTFANNIAVGGTGGNGGSTDYNGAEGGYGGQGGSGYGGGVFVRSGGSVSFDDASFASSNAVSGGAGGAGGASPANSVINGSFGSNAGEDAYLMHGTDTTFRVSDGERTVRLATGGATEWIRDSYGYYRQVSSAGLPSLTKTGAGDLRIAGTNLPMDITILEGRLIGGLTEVGYRRSVQTGDSTYQYSSITTHGVLVVDEPNGGGFNQVVRGPGSVRFSGSPGININLSQSLTHSGGTTIDAGVKINGASFLFAGDYENNGTVEFRDYGDYNRTFTGMISGTGRLEKTGTAGLEFVRSNTYSGGTDVMQGTLYASGYGEGNGGSSLGTGDVIVRNGATLAGWGSVAPSGVGGVTVELGATLSPGGVNGVDIPNNLSIGDFSGSDYTSFLTLENGSRVRLAVGSDKQDFLQIAGDLNLAGTVNVEISEAGAATPGLYYLIQHHGDRVGDLTNLSATLPTDWTGRLALDASPGAFGVFLELDRIGMNVRDGVATSFASGESLAGLTTHSEVFQGSTDRTRATILDGSVAGTSSVSMTFTDLTGFGTAANSVLGTILNLEGTDGTPIALQLSYDPTQVTLGEAPFLGWWDGSEFVGATEGNYGAGGLAGYYELSYEDFLAAHGGAFDGGSMFGAYGTDLIGRTTWAVIDHNSFFSVTAVPEPREYALGILVALGLMVLVRRRSNGAFRN